MKIRVKRTFLDKENKLIQRNVNDVFEASEDRAKELSEKGFVSILEETSETAQEAPQSDKTGETVKDTAAEKKPSKRRTKAAEAEQEEK